MTIFFEEKSIIIKSNVSDFMLFVVVFYLGNHRRRHSLLKIFTE